MFRGFPGKKPKEGFAAAARQEFLEVSGNVSLQIFGKYCMIETKKE